MLKLPFEEIYSIPNLSFDWQVLMHWFQKLTSIRHPMAFMKTRSMAAMTRYDVSHDLTKFKFFIKLSPTGI